MTHIASQLAASQAEVASLRGALSQSRADCMHLRARLAILDERAAAGHRRGIQALCETGRPITDDYLPGMHGGTGFAPGAWL